MGADEMDDLNLWEYLNWWEKQKETEKNPNTKQVHKWTSNVNKLWGWAVDTWAIARETCGLPDESWKVNACLDWKKVSFWNKDWKKDIFEKAKGMNHLEIWTSQKEIWDLLQNIDDPNIAEELLSVDSKEWLAKFLDENSQYLAWNNMSKEELAKTIKEYENKGENPSFLQKILLSAFCAMSWNKQMDWMTAEQKQQIDWMSESWEKCLSIASFEVNKHESNRETDKYFSETWHWWVHTNSTPWCAAFVNWTLKQAWYETTWSNMAKSFIKWAWSWHVWFMTEDKRCLWWNQSNKVSIININKPIVWWIMPDQVWKSEANTKTPIDPKDVPTWAIIVFDRSETKKSDKNLR